jgi:hypothetical protein
MIEEIAAQFEGVPAANVGVITGQVSGLVGIDVDGPEGQRLLRETSGDEGTPDTLTFRTTRGVRVLYALEPGMTVRSWSIRRGGSEVKVLGEGSLTVMPPSRHVSGKMYRWLRGRGPGQVKLAVVPQWVGRPTQGARRPGGQKTKSTGGGRLIPKGQRNSTLFRIACAMRGRGMTVEEIVAEIRVLNQQCVPPLDVNELKTLARSASRYPPSR